MIGWTETVFEVQNLVLQLLDPPILHRQLYPELQRHAEESPNSKEGQLERLPSS